MANKTQKTNSTVKTNSTAKTNSNANKNSDSTVSEAVKEPVKKAVPKDIDPNQLITVYNGFQGGLVYVSPRTKEVFKWDSFGDTQEIELRELRNAKSSSKVFFINNWFMFNDDESWVIDYLGVRNFYKNALSIDHFDDIFSKSPNEIIAIVSNLSDGQKRSVSYRARQLISSGDIDSNKAIAALEEALGEELVER